MFYNFYNRAHVTCKSLGYHLKKNHLRIKSEEIFCGEGEVKVHFMIVGVEKVSRYFVNSRKTKQNKKYFTRLKHFYRVPSNLKWVLRNFFFSSKNKSSTDNSPLRVKAAEKYAKNKQCFGTSTRNNCCCFLLYLIWSGDWGSKRRSENWTI